jgi:hypothetical protein
MCASSARSLSSAARSDAFRSSKAVKSILTLAAGSSWPSAAIKDGAYRPHKVILHEENVLWKRGQAECPPSSSQVPHFPFEFRLPDTLPSSFDCGSTGASGTIFYYVEVIANRRGLLNMDRHMRVVFGVLSASSAIEVDSARRLRQGWDGKLMQYVEKKTVKQKLWSHSINVEAEVRLFDLPYFLSLKYKVSSRSQPCLRLMGYCHYRSTHRSRSHSLSSHIIRTNPKGMPSPLCHLILLRSSCA